jgi:nicotinate phosphoribosyltransferase
MELTISESNTTPRTAADGSEELTSSIQHEVTRDLKFGLPTFEDRLEGIKQLLPEKFEPYSDKYFLRTHQILNEEGLNPFVRAQIFIRKGPGKVGGVEEAVAMLDRYTQIRANGGKVYALEEGADYGPKETLMVIEARIQDIIALETLYLGALSAETTRVNDGVESVDLVRAEEKMRRIVELADGRPVMYFGARHWTYREDAAIAAAAFRGGASSCSTDNGALAFGQVGQGTIPHALENIYAYTTGKNNAVVEATKAFDRVIDPSVPRIALIDYNNKELDDSVAVAQALGEKLYAVRVDTCGENVAQGALISDRCEEADSWKKVGIQLPSSDDSCAKYWYGTGVTITGVYALRKALDQHGFSNVKIVLTSGFGDSKKVEAFLDAEKQLNVPLFDALGVGGIYEPCRMATMDIVAVGESLETLTPLSKVGRPYRGNARLKRVL